MNYITSILTVIGKNLIGMFLTENMVFWSLEKAAAQTDTMVDDNVVKLVRAAYENDTDSFKAAVSALLTKTPKE